MRLDLEVVGMMYGYGASVWWMVLMPLLWTAVIATAVWAVIRLTRAPAPGAYSGVTPRQIIDRRFAAGEIDEPTYTRMRDQLSGSRPAGDV